MSEKARHRCYNFPSEFVTLKDVEGPDKCCPWCRSFPRGEWRQAIGTTWSGEGTTPTPKIPGGKIPTGLSVAFYKALKKAGYMRDPLTGDYQ